MKIAYGILLGIMVYNILLVLKMYKEMLKHEKQCKEYCKINDGLTLEQNELVLEQISEAINELKAGRNEQVYNILVDLSDELTIDIITQKAER